MKEKKRKGRRKWQKRDKDIGCKFGVEYERGET
jgi:hypothetical protein